MFTVKSFSCGNPYGTGLNPQELQKNNENIPLLAEIVDK